MLGPGCRAYLLAGGQSARFGSDKARAAWGGSTLLQSNAELLREAGAEVTVVARDDGAYADLGLRTIADIAPGKGPLAGIHAALTDAGGAPWVLVLACDLAGVQASWLRELWDARQTDCEAIVLGSIREQPLLGLYAQPLRPSIEAALAENRLGVIRFLAGRSVLALPLPSDWPALRNLNSESEWRQANPRRS